MLRCLMLKKMRNALWLSGVSIGLCFGLARGVYAGKPDTLGKDLPWADARMLAEVLDRVEHDYVNAVDDHQLLQAAIRGMVSSLDPYSAYLDGDEYDEIKISSSGEYSGVGIEVSMEDDQVVVVSPFDGSPAAAYYADLIGSTESSLSPEDFAYHPVGVVIDSNSYVRSIQKANPDGTLTFYCAIDEGLVLRTAYEEDLVANLEQAFAAIRGLIGPPQLVIAFDCILRKLAIQRGGYHDTVESLLHENRVVGFNSYGEQYRGVHVNQTLTGIAIGELTP